MRLREGCTGGCDCLREGTGGILARVRLSEVVVLDLRLVSLDLDGADALLDFVQQGLEGGQGDRLAVEDDKGVGSYDGDVFRHVSSPYDVGEDDIRREGGGGRCRSCMCVGLPSSSAIGTHVAI